jgi:ABC-type Fe3+ transport system substrate-binding protein
VSQFEAAFETTYPQYRLEILWRQSKDAITYLHQKHLPIDVYWTPAQRNFAVLAKEGAFRKLDIDLTGLPKIIGGFQISDPDGYYVASETAGYGIAYNPATLAKLNLPIPTDWKALTSTIYSDQIVFPIPSKVGYAPMLVDTMLQSYGWNKGWAILEQIAANAKLADAGATFISDDVGSGTVAVGATLDFFAKSAIANGKPINYVYPEKVGYSPAHVAIFNEATDVAGAKAFANFVLSEQGQDILFHPDIRKLPVRPSVYKHKPEGYFDPFASAKKASYSYDMAAGILRQELVSAMFDTLITRHHDLLKVMWSRLNEAESKFPNDPRLSEAKAHASWLPLTLEQANQTEIQQAFISRTKNAEDLEQKWGKDISMHYLQASQLAQAILNGQ